MKFSCLICWLIQCSTDNEEINKPNLNAQYQTLPTINHFSHWNDDYRKVPLIVSAIVKSSLGTPNVSCQISRWSNKHQNQKMNSLLWTSAWVACIRTIFGQRNLRSSSQIHGIDIWWTSRFNHRTSPKDFNSPVFDHNRRVYFEIVWVSNIRTELSYLEAFGHRSNHQ